MLHAMQSLPCSCVMCHALAAALWPHHKGFRGLRAHHWLLFTQRQRRVMLLAELILVMVRSVQEQRKLSAMQFIPIRFKG